jgi:hypothetical protein
MSENNKPAIFRPKLSHIPEKDLIEYMEFIEAGMPGLGQTKHGDEQKMFDWYMDGFSVREISMKTRFKKEIVYYFMEKYNWHEQFIERAQDMIMTQTSKMAIYQNQTPEFYIELGYLIRKSLQKSIDQYRSTKDPRILDSLNASLIDKAVKIDTFLKDIQERSKNPDTPNIVVNNYAAPENPSSDTIDVTPNNNEEPKLLEEPSSLLKALAELKRKRQNTK